MWLPLKERAGFTSDGGFQTLVGDVDGEVKSRQQDQFNTLTTLRLVARDGSRHHVAFRGKMAPDIRRGEKISVYGYLDRQGIFQAVKISDAGTGAILADAGGCFVATAACGHPEAPEVLRLRAFRDEVLMPRVWGRALTYFYYRISPRPASWLTRHDFVRAFVRRALIRPAAALAGKWCNRGEEPHGR